MDQISLEGKVYIASDFHLGTSGKETSIIRELRISRWLQSIRTEVNALILVGDIFDYWYEYRQVIPRGFSHFWSEIRQLTNNNVPVYFFTGNHDMWMFDYPETEYGVKILREPTFFSINKLSCVIHHGDGLGPGDYGYKCLKKLFTSRLCQFLFSRLHPNLAIWIMRSFSKTSRKYGKEEPELVPDQEWLVQYCEDYIKKNSSIDYFIFGHRHLPINHILSNGHSTYLNLGDWLYHYSYAEVEEDKIILKKYDE